MAMSAPGLVPPPVRLEHYRDPKGNFGDDLNPWLWPRVRPGLLDDDPRELFIGMGTLLNPWFTRRLPPAAHRHVFGTGAGYGDPPEMGPRWTVHCVRGPRTAKAIGVSPEKAVTDPAALVACTELPLALPGRHVAFMPHHRSARRAPWSLYCGIAGLRYIDPRWPVERVLGELRGCDLVAAEAMHGAIVADALRIPWVACFLHEQVHEPKWLDWTESLGLELRPLRMQAPLQIKGGARRGVTGRLRTPFAVRWLAKHLDKSDGQLSPESRLAAAQEELLRRLAAVRPTQ
jgi:succinoglycan biosynthesis protein ExoV